MRTGQRTIHLQYFAQLRQERGVGEESLTVECATPAELYKLLQARHRFSLAERDLRVAVNDEFADWTTLLADGDRVVFIPPVAGG
jgi:molybdopterin converting factor subunit 1